jgi:hypothetical protein
VSNWISTAASLVMIGGLLAACTPPAPLVLQGDANSVTIGYGGGDLARAAVVAARHCARYERVPRFQMADMDTAYYACVEP